MARGAWVLGGVAAGTVVAVVAATVVEVVALAPDAAPEFDVEPPPAVVVVAGAVVVVAGSSLVARQRFRSSVAVVVHVIGIPVEVTPVAPDGEQKEPDVTVAWPLA